MSRAVGLFPAAATTATAATAATAATTTTGTLCGFGEGTDHQAGRGGQDCRK
jgi:hypothetical protein